MDWCTLVCHRILVVLNFYCTTVHCPPDFSSFLSLGTRGLCWTNSALRSVYWQFLQPSQFPWILPLRLANLQLDLSSNCFWNMGGNYSTEIYSDLKPPGMSSYIPDLLSVDHPRMDDIISYIQTPDLCLFLFLKLGG